MLESAKWLSAGKIDGCPEFIGRFETAKKIKKATLEMSACGVYYAELNGKPVGDFVLAPGWTVYAKRIQVQTYDVTAGKIFKKLGYDKFLDKIYTLDTTEIEGTDNLHNAKEIIKSSQERTAKIFNSDESIYLVNGSTCGVEAAIMATCEPKSKIITNRDCHQSVINACILGNIEPIYIKSNICKETNIINGVEVKEVKKIIDDNLDAKVIILTYPTYYGSVYDLKTICEYAHSKDMIVVVDEAHGAHLQLSDELPKSSILQGADIIIQSTHKTLPAFTQSLILQSLILCRKILTFPASLQTFHL